MSEQWKVDERKVARALGGMRVALSGGRGAVACCDVLTGHWAVEVKRRARCVVLSWYAQAVLQARRLGMKPVLVVHVSRSQSWLVVLSLSDFCQLAGINPQEVENETASGVCASSGE